LVVAALAMALPAWSVEIPAGTHVLLRMVNSISTKTAQEGDYVYLRTTSPISVNDRIVVPPNSYVQGRVTYSKRAGKIKGRAEIAIRLESLTLPRGKMLHLSASPSSLDSGESGQRVDKEEGIIKQSPDHGRDAKQIAILAGSGASLGAIVSSRGSGSGWTGAGIGSGIGAGVGLATVLLSRGKDVDLRPGTSLDVVFDRPVSLD
jgi:type IV secretion system protein VirB10